MTNFWTSCLSQFEQELPPQQFNTWIRPLRLEGEEDFAQGLRLLAPNGFILKWVKERYLARIEALGSAFFSSPVSVTLMLGERAKTPNAPSAPNVPSTPSVSPQMQERAFAPAKLTNGALPAQERAREQTNSLYDKTRLITG